MVCIFAFCFQLEFNPGRKLKPESSVTITSIKRGSGVVKSYGILNDKLMVYFKSVSPEKTGNWLALPQVSHKGFAPAV